jgi:predicted RNA binding protein YcfA (HicA-like mRNA interferase family)
VCQGFVLDEPRRRSDALYVGTSPYHEIHELVRLLERNGFALVKEKGSVRYDAKEGHPNLIRIDYHGAKEVPTGTCNAILKAAGLKGHGGSHA